MQCILPGHCYLFIFHFPPLFNFFSVIERKNNLACFCFAYNCKILELTSNNPNYLVASANYFTTLLQNIASSNEFD